MGLSKLFEKTEDGEFTTFPTTLETYAWYKPILIFVIAAVVSLVITFAAMSIIKADPTKDGIIRLVYAAVSMIAMIPAIYVGTKLMYKIPFSTQVAPIREWNWSIYIKAFIITAIVYSVIVVFPMLISGIKISNDISIFIILLCLILPVFQGFAEEYLCRGLMMQTFGSWFKIPVVAIIIQAAIFAVMHPYQLFALMGVFCTGLAYGLITWYGRGLEASSAMHAVNNIFSFLAIGLGLQQGAAESTPQAFLVNFVLLVIPIIILLILDKKFNLFGFER